MRDDRDGARCAVQQPLAGAPRGDAAQPARVRGADDDDLGVLGLREVVEGMRGRGVRRDRDAQAVRGDPLEPVAHVAGGLLGVVREVLAVGRVGRAARRVAVSEGAGHDDARARGVRKTASEGDRVLGARRSVDADQNGAHGGSFGRWVSEDRPAGPVGKRVAGLAAGREEPRQVAAADLAGGPPELGARDAHGCPAQRAGERAVVVEVAAQEQRRLAGEDDAAQHAAAGAGREVGAGLGRDRLGRGVGLLGGEAALLDRPGRRVAGGEDVARAGDAAVLVDSDEALGIRRQAGDPRALQARERDHGVGGDQAPVAGRERAADDRLGHRLALEADARAIQQAGERIGGHGPEEVQRPRLGRDDRELGAVRQLVRGEQRQLVERQRPAGAGRQREQHALARPAERALDRARTQRAAERGRAGHGFDRSRAGGDDQAVVADAHAVRGADLVALGVHRAEGPMATDDPELREAAERHPRGALAAERGEDRRWALHEVVAGGEHLDGDAIAGERVEGQDGLDRGDAATGDEDAQWVGGGGAWSCHGPNDRMAGAAARHRGGPRRRCGFPAGRTRRHGGCRAPRTDLALVACPRTS